MTHLHRPAPDADLIARMKDRGLSRRQMLGLLGIGGAGLGAAACGSPVEAEGGGDGGGENIREGFTQADISVPAEYSDRTAILFWAPFTGTNLAAVESLFEKFNESQDEIYAAAESVGNYGDLTTQFTAAIQARQVPDIVCFPEMQWLQFFWSDSLVALDGYFDSEWSLDVYIQNYVEESVAGGQAYTVPFARSTPLFYYNRTMFEDLGLPSEGPSTWQEFEEMAPEIMTVEVEGQSVGPIAYHTVAWQNHHNVWGWGGSWSDGLDVTADSDPVHEWLEWVRQFIHEEGFGYTAQAPFTDFQTGLAACCQASTAGLSAATEAADFEIGTTFLLGRDSPGPQVPTGGSGLQLVRTESQDRQDACAELLRFLAQPENAAQFHRDTGYVPIVEESREHSITQELVSENPNYGVALDQLDNAQTVEPVMWIQSCVEEASEAIALVCGDDADPEQVLANLQSTLESTVESNLEGLQEALDS